MTRCFIFAIVILWTIPASARPFRQMDVPNWDDDKFGGAAGCGSCHINNAGGGARTMFGTAAGGALNTLIGMDAHATWADLYMLDSDGDGYTNGVELGDPAGGWVLGDANPVVAEVWDPGDANDTPCGDGAIQAPEECDGLDLNGMTCVSLGSVGAGLECLNCGFNTNNCASTNNTTNTNNTNNSNNTTGSNNTIVGVTNNNGNVNNGGGNNNNNQASGEPKDEVDAVGRTCSAVVRKTASQPWFLLAFMLVALYRRTRRDA